MVLIGENPRVHLDPGVGTMMQVSGFSTEAERTIYNSAREYGYPSAHPWSVFIAVTGTMWKRGCWEKVIDMLMFNRQHGLQCWLEEIPDTLCSEPFVDLPKMRASGVRKARNAGLESTLILECDAEPQPDMLLKLRAHDYPIVAPYIDDGAGRSLGRPRYQQGQGLMPVKWATFTCLLIDNRVWNGMHHSALSDIHTEGPFFEELWSVGHRAMMDTDTVLPVATLPSRYGERVGQARRDWLDQVDEARRRPPDRMPLDPHSPYIVDGVYAPYAITDSEERARYYEHLTAKMQEIQGDKHG